MTVLYLMTALPPAVAGTDSVVQEAEILRSRFGGEVIFLPPSSRPRSRLPRWLYGWQCLPRVRSLEQSVDLCHIYHAELYPFPVLRFLRKPILYSVASGLGADGRIPKARDVSRLAGIVVPTPGERERLRKRGHENVHVIAPGVDRSRFHQTPPPSEPGFVLLAGSAPWTKKQFRTKGVEALLEVARRMPDLRLLFLWRGWMIDEIRFRVKALGLAARVEILDEWVDVDRALGRAHAAVVLADKERLVRAYPQSLLEALACGKPVLVSECIAMAEYVRTTGCGVVVPKLGTSELHHAVERLRREYETCRLHACRVGHRDFPLESLALGYGALYESIGASSGAR
jgi:glycosyltransferase involved in cell wall biosynthesis